MTNDIKPMLPINLEKALESLKNSIEENKTHTCNEYREYIGKELTIILDIKGMWAYDPKSTGYSFPLTATISREEKNHLILQDIFISKVRDYTPAYMLKDAYKSAKINKDYIIGILEG